MEGKGEEVTVVLGEALPTEVRVGGLKVTFLGDHTNCKCGVIGWCPHAEAALKGDDEPMALHNALVAHDPFMYDHIGVPIIPSLGCWAAVRAESLREFTYSVYFVEDPPDGLPNFLGIIGPEEGRGAIRTLVVAWVHSYGKNLSCQSSAHNFKRMRAMQAAGPAMQFVNNWTMLWKHMCEPCSKDMEGDDLIPDAGTSTARRPW